MKSILIITREGKTFKQPIKAICTAFRVAVVLEDSEAETRLPEICEQLGLSIDSAKEVEPDTFKIGDLQNINHDFEIVVKTNVPKPAGVPLEPKKDKEPNQVKEPKAKAKAKAKTK